MAVSSAAVLGAVGGAGATRLAVEFGALLARDDRDVAILDAAYATQGLARHVADRIDPDVTALVTADDPTLADALSDHPLDVPGRLALCPAHAPFERIARAKAPEAARAFEDLVAQAAADFDHVLLDVPPVAANQSVAAVTTAERVCVAYPPTDRGVDALQRTRGRLADVGAGADLVVANRADPDTVPPDADHAIPASDATTAAAAPSCLDAGDPMGPAVADVVTALFETGLDVDVAGGLLDSARRRL
ncbi:MAG: ParA family protein [Halobacteriaceae archaeon]